MRSPEESYRVQLSNNSNTVSQNITIESLSGSISGKVLLPNSQVISDEVYVFVNRIKSKGTDKPYFEDTQTTNGEFNFLLKEGYDYEVGVFLDPNSDYAEPPVQEISLVSVNSVANIELILGTADSTISGNIKLSDGSSMDEEVYVYAWSSKGQAVEGKSAADGSYSLKVASGAIWYVGSDYQRINNDGSNTNFRTAKEVKIDLLTASSDVAQDLTIFEQDYNLPTSIADSFVVSSGYTKVLDDGTEIKIPANAVPVSDTSSSVTINISPVTTGLSSTSSTKPIGYGYSFEILDSSGKAITSNFTKDVIITVPYKALNIGTADESDIKVSFYSASKGAWEEAKSVTVDTNANKVFATVDHFSSWSVTAPQSESIAVNTTPSMNDISISAAENTSANTIIGKIEATDNDQGDRLTYEIVSGNSSGLFAIDASNGNISTTSSLDYEQVTNYLLTVRATDSGSASVTANANILVIDVNDNIPLLVSPVMLRLLITTQI